MKVALVIEHFDATRGAAEHMAVWIAGQLAERGHEVHVVCHDVAARVNRYRQATLRASHDAGRSFQAHPPAEVAHPGIHIHRLRGMRLNTGLGMRRFRARARAWCLKHAPDVVHGFTVAFPGDIYHACEGVFAEIQAQTAANRAAGAGAALKRMLLGGTMKQRSLVALERRAMGATREGGAVPKRIISLSAVMTEQFERHYKSAAKRVVPLVTPRLDLNGGRDWSNEKAARERAWFRRHYHLSAEDRVALFVGHDFRRKGLRYAIEAIARTGGQGKGQGWKLLIVGLGKVREYVELVEKLGLDGGEQAQEARVLFVGPTREMDQVYAAADAIILPTFYEPWGLIVPEALGHGLPVVSTASLASAALVRREGVGTIVASPRAVVEMAAALEALPAAGTREHEQLAAKARMAGTGTSPKKYIEALLALYDDVRKER